MQFTFLGDNSPKPFSFDYLGDNTPPAAAPAPAAEEDDEDEEDALDDHEALDHIGDVGPEVFVDYSTFEDRDGSDGSTQEESEENPMRASARRESAALEFDDFLPAPRRWTSVVAKTSGIHENASPCRCSTTWNLGDSIVGNKSSENGSTRFLRCSFFSARQLSKSCALTTTRSSSMAAARSHGAAQRRGPKFKERR